MKNFVRYVRRRMHGMGHLGGFGIQSPFAYSFIRDVIAEKWPYYQFEELGRSFPHLSGKESKQAQLLFRLSNHLQAESVFIDEQIPDYLYTYIHAGCKKTQRSEDVHSSSWLILSGRSSEILSSIFEYHHGGEETLYIPYLLILYDIYENGMPVQTWRKILDLPFTKVTFDLYSIGIVFFTPNYHSADYLLNF